MLPDRAAVIRRKVALVPEKIPLSVLGTFPRRKFLRWAGTAVCLAGFPELIPASALGAEGRPAASNRIAMGAIGTGNQGHNDLRGFLGDERVQMVAVCDANRESSGYWDGKVGGRDPARRLVDSHYAAQKASVRYKGCQAYEDFQDLLARKDIDAVTVALPDHWHAIPYILACKAGKDVYGQKPLALTIDEGRAISNAVLKYNRIFQTGSQQRSNKHFRFVCELVRNGRLGKLHTIKVGLPGGRPDYAKTGNRKKTEPVPKGFNYDLWLGPAPQAPYSPARCHVNFRWLYDYSGGQVTDWGGHHIDCAQWGMGTELTGPVELKNAKGTFPEDELWNTATEFSFDAIFQNGVKMLVSNKNKGGVTFEGTEGWAWANRGSKETRPEALLETQFGPNDIRLYASTDHYRNFIDCVISRQAPAAPCEVAHRSITIAHLGNIAMRLGRDLRWDPNTEQITGDDSANQWLKRPYRAPWKLPQV